MELSNPFNALQTYEETAMINSETSITVYQAPATPRGKKRRALSSPKKMVTPTPINTPKSILLKAKTLIERAIKKKTDHANKTKLETAILDLQIALGQKPRTKNVNISGQDTNIQIALLQKQVTDIEANMAKKMNQVLEVISQKKTPTYAEIASKNLPIPQVVIIKKPASQAGNPITVQKKPAEKPREKSVYREKRLILQTSKDFIKNLDAI